MSSARTPIELINLIKGSKDSLAIGGAGYDAAASVRLLHAVVRRYCVRKEWNVAAYGSPINQEDMLGTLASFSPCVIIGMEKIGLTFTPAEQDAYCARWRYVGYLLGLTPEALALISNYNSARYVGEVIALRQLAPDEDSTRLTTMSLEAVESHYPVLSKLPKNVLTCTRSPSTAACSPCAVWCRWFLGNELADAMEVPKPSWVTLLWWAFVRAMMKIGFFVSRNFPFLRPIWKALNVRSPQNTNIQLCIHEFPLVLPRIADIARRVRRSEAHTHRLQDRVRRRSDLLSSVLVPAREGARPSMATRPNFRTASGCANNRIKN